MIIYITSNILYIYFFFVDLSVIKLEEGSPVTRDLRNNRVRVFYDNNGKVSSKPTIG